jgi:hypothetical protein
MQCRQMTRFSTSLGIGARSIARQLSRRIVSERTGGELVVGSCETVKRLCSGFAGDTGSGIKMAPGIG